MTVAEHLAQSRAAHTEYRRLSLQRGAAKRVPLQQAYDARVAAHDADPEHLDASWALDLRATHAELMTFYRRTLGM